MPGTDDTELNRIRGEDGDFLNEEEETVFLTDQEQAEKDCQEAIRLRQCANNMLLFYGIASFIPRMISPIIRVGMWDSHFSAYPSSLWGMILYSLLPFVMYFYSVKAQRTEKILLGYSFLLRLDIVIAICVEIFQFFTTLSGFAEFQALYFFRVGFLSLALNSSFYFFISNMHRKYKELYSLQRCIGVASEERVSLFFRYLYPTPFFVFLILICYTAYATFGLFCLEHN